VTDNVNEATKMKPRVVEVGGGGCSGGRPLGLLWILGKTFGDVAGLG
jgi:hypothetical protein